MKSIVAALILTVGSFGLSDSKADQADVIFTNGNLYTVDAKQPRAQAVAIKNGRIVFVGSSSGAKAHVGKDTKIIDLKGATVVPGLTDAHYHLMGVGLREVTLNLEGTSSLEAFLAKTKERVDKTAPGKWVTGRGWIETFWKPQAFPSRHDLDGIAPNNPVFLTRADGHAGIANTAALKIAGIDKNTTNPFGGEILRDKTSGEATGMLIDAAQGLVRRHVPGITATEREEALLLGIKRTLSLGWTQIHTAGGGYSDADLYRKVISDGKAKLRIYNAVSGPGEASRRLLADGATIGDMDNRFTMRTIKVVLDGALGSRGAALLAPYSDAETSGFLTAKPEELGPLFIEALQKGIQVETHAIGDRANRLILDLYEEAFKAVPPDGRKVKDPRWRIEHAQIVDDVDLPRFAKLGVIASMQPSHAIGDLFFAPSRLGQKRLTGAYAWQKFIKSGAIIAGGSDAPVERGEPMIEFYAAVARKGLKGESGEGWHREQAVSREQALRIFTLWPAYAAFEERDKGSIEVGKLADLTILSHDIMKIPDNEILGTKCLMTVIGGEIVFDGRSAGL
ncbi:MAG: amidohydrolase [Pyrinomonadaceae bacterium]